MTARPMMKWFLLTGGLPLAACADKDASCDALADMTVDVFRDHSLPDRQVPTTFMIIANSPEQAEDPFWSVSANQVAVFLENAGHRRVFPWGAETAHWDVTVETVSPWSSAAGTFPAACTYRYGSEPMEQDSVCEQQFERRDKLSENLSRLSVCIAVRGRTVYRGHAETLDENAPSLVGASRLARALLDPFPGPCGELHLDGAPRRVTVAAE